MTSAETKLRKLARWKAKKPYSEWLALLYWHYSHQVHGESVFLRKRRPCKIGTIPMVVQVHGKDEPRIKVEAWVRVRYAEGGRWESVLVTRTDPDGYFMADR